MLKEDCFGYSKDLGKCVVLKETVCRKNDCNFYRTEKDRCRSCLDMKNKIVTCHENIELRNCRRVVL